MLQLLVTLIEGEVLSSELGLVAAMRQPLLSLNKSHCEITMQLESKMGTREEQVNTQIIFSYSIPLWGEQF